MHASTVPEFKDNSNILVKIGENDISVAVRTDNTGRANILSNHFKSVFIVVSNKNFPNKGTSPYPTIPNFTISEELVYMQSFAEL